jgi:hypothetical protein
VAIGVGFVGWCSPGGASFSIYSITAIMVALLISVRDLVTRRLDPAIPTPAITLTTTVSVCALGFLGSPLQDWQPVQAGTLWLLAGSAVLVTANVSIIRAFRGTDIARLTIPLLWRDGPSGRNLARHAQYAHRGHDVDCWQRPLHYAPRILRMQGQ